MNKIYFLLALLFVSFYGKGQIINANDSVSTGRGNINMVFYNLATGVKTITSDTDWHIAVSVRATQFPYHPLGGTTIRINEAIGVNAYVAPNADASGYADLDTTGWRKWWHLHDSDTSIDEGALNSNRNHTDLFNYGWGEYNQTSHNVIGDSVYLIQLPWGGLKKLEVIDLIYDTAFDIKYSNLDNSDLQLIHISKGVNDNSNKEFMYVNLLDNSVHDKEPVNTAWDLEFLKYAAVDTPGVQGGTMPVPGVWINEGTMVAKAIGVEASSNSYNGLTFSANLNTIGWNWKPLNAAVGTVQDSLAYFIQTIAGEYFKVIFTGYNDTTGIFDFYKQALTGSTGVNELSSPATVSLFPNPANELVNIIHSSSIDSKYQIMNVSGDIVLTGNSNGPLLQLNTGQLAAGFYIVDIIDNENVSTLKLLIEH